MKRILFFSYKGGVGRSVTLCNTAAALCRRGLRIGIVDFDVEAPSLHIQFEAALPVNWRWDDFSADILSLLRIDIDSITPKAVEEAVITLSLPWPESCCILLPCFGRGADLKKLETNWASKMQTVAKIFDMLENSFNLDFLLIDARTGFSQPGLVAACASDHVVAVSRADQVSVLGMKQMLNSFRHRPMEKIHLVVTGIPESIRENDTRLTAFVQEMQPVDNTIYFPYVSDWYFGGEVLWEVSSKNQHLTKHYDLISEKLIG